MRQGKVGIIQALELMFFSKMSHLLFAIKSTIMRVYTIDSRIKPITSYHLITIAKMFIAMFDYLEVRQQA